MSIRELEQSHADLSKIPPLEPNRLVGFMNHFAVNLVRQLNNLALVADQKLSRLQTRIVQCKTNLVILEKKLSSVDGLSPDPNPVKLPETVADVNNVATPETSDRKEDETDEINMRESMVQSSQEDEIPTDAIISSETNTPAASSKEDVELQRFYKMLKVGVPLPAVRMKMVSDGLDPDRLRL